ncbi:hypothetical protein BD414DRAFT_519645 [Trametes punicea]|nr:hypothetical protein BD414DRAFT_519645 [Trametes punicea]
MSMWSVQSSAVYWCVLVPLLPSLTILIVTTAILYYDYVLTLFHEIEFFWRSANLSLVSVLFVINRYLGILGPIPIAIEYFSVDLSEEAGRFLQTYHQAYAICSQGIVAIMLVIRTYALYERSRRILVLLIATHLAGGIMCLISMVTNLSPEKTSTPLPFKFTGCDLSLTDEQCVNIALAWGAMLWFDTTIFALTLVRALRMRRHLPGGLIQIMFRDGTIYYGIMVAANVSNIITFLVTRSGSPLKGMDTTLTNVLSTTLTSRLILNLRNPKLQRPRRVGDVNQSNAWNATSVPPVSRSITFDCTLTEVLVFTVEAETSAADGV